MPLLDTKVHVNESDVLFSYPGSWGVRKAKRKSLRRVKGSNFWFVQVAQREAERLFDTFGTMFRKDSEAE